jgi:acyl-CoA thioesterase
MQTHAFDDAIALTRLPDPSSTHQSGQIAEQIAGQVPGQTPAQHSGHYTGHTSPRYWNMVGPYGGITAAIVINAVMQHPALLGAPISLTINYAGALAAGAFSVSAQPVRTNRSTQHWCITLSQTDAEGQDQVTTTATVVTAARRETWSASDSPRPAAPAPETLPVMRPPAGSVAWIDSFEMRGIQGGIPTLWDGSESAGSLTQLWLRDHPARPLDFMSLASLADLFYPRIWLRRALRTPAGTVSMTVYFHADSAQLAATGSAYLLGQAQGQAYRNGFFDQTGQLWNPQGQLLASTHQIVYFKA